MYLVAHAGYKGALFLVAGAIDHETGTRDISALAGLRRAMPITALAGGAAALSMAGVPLTLGFVGKDGAYEALLHATDWYPWLLVLMVLASILLGLAGLIAGVLPFRGDVAPAKEVHDPAWPLWLPPLLLAAGGLFVGVAPSILNGPLSAAATAIAGVPVDVSLSVWHGITPRMLLSVLTLAAVGSRTWCTKPFGRGRGSRGMEARILYDGALSGAERGEPRNRSGVAQCVIANVRHGHRGHGGPGRRRGAGHRSGPGLRGAAHQHRCPRCPHRLLIIAGAIAAAFARSTMSAVLSLGAVGYGVATMFLSFGAPDLAMTQFSVETLTVLIYVLVFRHFRGLGPLSSRLVRARDGLIAVGDRYLHWRTARVRRDDRDGPETAGVLRRVWTDPGAWAKHRQRHPGRFPGVRYTRRNHGPGNCGTWRPWVAAIRGNPSTGPIPSGPSTSPIFRTAARLLMPLLLVFSVFLLLRGHNQPGGGFVGGLVAAAAFALYAIAFGVHRARQALLVRPLTLLGAGLLIALLSGVPAVLRGQPFLTALWAPGSLPLGTPAMFDVGVFLVVAGVVLMMIFSLAEES